MTATNKLRLFVPDALAEGISLVLPQEQGHYLTNVMRCRAGERIGLFNGRDGEWSAVFMPEGKKTVRLQVETQVRQQIYGPDLWLLFAPVKRTRVDFIVEKAVELGVSALAPVWTEHVAVTRVKDERLEAIAIEASEQCRRLDVPAVMSPRPLIEMLADWSAERRLVVLDETGGGVPILDALAGLSPSPFAVLVGPEGGFSQSEIAALAAMPFVVRVGLGPRILRADTAAIAALTCVQAALGDWRRDMPAIPFSKQR